MMHPEAYKKACAEVEKLDVYREHWAMAYCRALGWGPRPQGAAEMNLSTCLQGYITWPTPDGAKVSGDKLTAEVRRQVAGEEVAKLVEEIRRAEPIECEDKVYEPKLEPEDWTPEYNIGWQSLSKQQTFDEAALPLPILTKGELAHYKGGNVIDTGGWAADKDHETLASLLQDMRDRYRGLTPGETQELSPEDDSCPEPLVVRREGAP